MANKLKRAYQVQRCNASRRGIEWLFTFDGWLEFWTDSGHLSERGLKNNGYVMSRINDCGPYSPENCEIIRHSENTSQKQVLLKRRRGIDARPKNWKRCDDYARLRDRASHPKAKPVVAPDGAEYPSAALAAEAYGKTCARIGQMCRENYGGWKFKP